MGEYSAKTAPIAIIQPIKHCVKAKISRLHIVLNHSFALNRRSKNEIINRLIVLD